MAVSYLGSSWARESNLRYVLGRSVETSVFADRRRANISVRELLRVYVSSEKAALDGLNTRASRGNESSAEGMAARGEAGRAAGGGGAG